MASNTLDSSFVNENISSILKHIMQACKQEKEAGQLLVPLSSVVERAAFLTGVSESTLYRIQRQSKEGETVRQRKPYPKTIVLDDFDKSVVRRTVVDLSKRIVPTLADIAQELKTRIDFSGSRETLRLLLKELGFKWRATQSNRSILMEKPDIVAARVQYLRQIRRYREENRPVVYTDETFVHTNHSAKRSWQSDDFAIHVPFSKGNRFIVVHAGSENGFVAGADLVFKAKTTSGDYHSEMNSDNFLKWLQNKLIPNLPQRTVLVVDNAPYHMLQEDKCPTMADKKANMTSWLERNGVAYTPKMLKVELLQLCKTNRPRPKYKLDSLLEQHGHSCLRLPPYHAELNPIELIWSQVKSNVAAKNTTFKTGDTMALINEALAKVTPKDWMECVRHVIEIEQEFWRRDAVMDQDIERVVFTVTSSDEGTDTASSSDLEDYSSTDTADDEI